jgi:alkylation response protein AidB-like acyl-CoA dehydrogenase
MLSEEHQLLRQTVRELAEAKIAPFAAEVDAAARFPAEALDALTGARLHAVHIPEAHGGEGADALAAVIVIEEVARVCASSSLFAAVNKLGTVPLLLSASEELKRRYLPPVARGEALFSYAGVSQYYTVMAVTDPAQGARGISAFVVEKTDPGVSFGEPEKKLGRAGHPRPHPDHHRGAGAGHRPGRTRLRRRVCQGAAPVRTGGRGLPGRAVHAGRHGHETRGSRQLTYHAAALSERAMAGEKVPSLTFVSSACKTMASDVAMAVTTDTVQLLGGYGYVRDYPVERMMRDAKITQHL